MRLHRVVNTFSKTIAVVPIERTTARDLCPALAEAFEHVQIAADAILGRGGRLYRDFRAKLARTDDAYRAQRLAQARAPRGAR